MASLLPLFGALAVLVPIWYMYTVSVVSSRFPTLQNKRICLLIAHPDDEAMFFSPTLLALTRPDAGNHVKILCLSTGDAEGLGNIRKTELVKSAMTLGLRSEEDVFVVESPDFQDSMTNTWDSGKISDLLSSTFAPTNDTIPKKKNKTAAAAAAAAKPSTPTIDVLLTFDQGGISGHPNHRSLYRGARRFIANLLSAQTPPKTTAPVDLYTLTTIPLLRKYTSVVDVAATLATWAANFARGDKSKTAKEHPGMLVFLADLHPGATSGGLGTAWRAMTTAHKSQMVWFRYLWITFSRYMVINDLRLERDFGVGDQQSP